MKNERIANEDYSKPVCYFYIDDKGRIAYIGKANGTIEDRVKAHAKEERFINCKCSFNIRYQVFDRKVDMDIAEKVYIKSLNPYLNVMDKTEGFFPMVNIDFEKMKLYVPKEKRKSHEKKQKKISPEKLKRYTLFNEIKYDSYLHNVLNMAGTDHCTYNKWGELLHAYNKGIILFKPKNKKYKAIFYSIARSIYELFKPVIWDEDEDSIMFSIMKEQYHYYYFFLFDVLSYVSGKDISKGVYGQLERSIYETKLRMTNPHYIYSEKEHREDEQRTI